MVNFIKDKNGDISSRILFTTLNSILIWVIIFICIYKNIDIQTGVLTLLIAITTKSGIDSVGQVCQNIKEINKQ